MTNAGPQRGAPGAGEEQVREFLSFRLGAEEYGIDLLKVQEIRGWEQPTAIANTPAFIKGVINLRGIIVPIVDLRLKFNLGEAKYDGFTVVIILSVANRVVGAVVDAVSDVITLGPQQIRPAPEFSATLETRFIVGLGILASRAIWAFAGSVGRPRNAAAVAIPARAIVRRVKRVEGRANGLSLVRQNRAQVVSKMPGSVAPVST